MNQAKLFKEFFRYTALNICGMIGLSCYILADTFFVSSGLGTNGLAALNLAIPIYSFIHGSGLMLGMGGATRYSLLRGQGKYAQMDRVFTCTVCLAFLFSAAFMFLGGFCAGEITSLLGANRDVYDMARTYLQMILLFSPAFIANNILLCFVRNDGSPGLTMTAMLAGSLSNILLDYLLIFPLRMGILGAVMATGLAPLISMGILSVHRLKGRNHFHLRKIGISLEPTLDILSLGIPSLVTEVASGIVMIVFNGIILSLQGNVGVAAYGVVANLSLVTASVYTGIAQGMQPLASRAHGSGDRDAEKKILHYAMFVMLSASICIYTVFFLAADPIAGIFNSEHHELLQQIAVTGLKVYFTALPFAGFNIVIAMYFTALGRALPAQAVSLARGFLIIIPAAFFLAYLLGMKGVWLSYPLTEGVVALMGGVLLCKSNR